MTRNSDGHSHKGSGDKNNELPLSRSFIGRESSHAYNGIKPFMYQIWLLHDKIHFDNVIAAEILNTYFKIEKNECRELIAEAIDNGYALCGIYTKDVAETKIHEAVKYSNEKSKIVIKFIMQKGYSHVIKKS